MHFHYGVDLLHRHGGLAPENVMVHSEPDPDTDVCKMRHLDIDLVPCSYYLNARRKFQPFDVPTGSAPR